MTEEERLARHRTYVTKLVDEAPPLTYQQREAVRTFWGLPPAPRPLNGADGDTHLELAPMLGPPRPMCLYRHFDHDGVLLYVGISNDPRRRRSDHRTAAWMRFADPARETWQWFADRLEVADAERRAIGAERPLFNLCGNADAVNPDAVKYLADRGCYDALRWGR